MSAIGGHHSPVAMKDEWLTPPGILASLGPFDLDPCSPVVRPWATARHHLTVVDDGLSVPWAGRVWCNPPYGKETGKWLARCKEHGDAVALIFARTETSDWTRHVWNGASGILFLHGRLHFHHVDGSRAKANSGAPSALIAYGDNNVEMFFQSGLKGSLVRNWELP